MKKIKSFNNAKSIDDIKRALDSDGAVILSDMVDADQLHLELSSYFARSKASEGPFYGYNTHRIGGLIGKSSVCRKLATDKYVLEAVGHALNSNCDRFQLNLTQGIKIEAGESAQFLHRDDAMFPSAGQHECMINVMIAVTDFTKENGATRLIPGSHKWEIDREPKDGETIYAEMPAGSCLIYLGSILHAGSKNSSDKSRIGAVLSYSLGWLKQAENFFLSEPWENIRDYPEELQRLLGYQIHKPNLGWVEGVDPIMWLKNGRPDVAQAKDALTDDLVELAEMAAINPNQFSQYLN